MNDAAPLVSVERLLHSGVWLRYPPCAPDRAETLCADWRRRGWHASRLRIACPRIETDCSRVGATEVGAPERPGAGANERSADR
jgi:hypothetical protein